MNPDEVAAKAAQIPVTPMGWAGSPMVPPSVVTPHVAPQLKSNIEKAHEIVKLLSSKGLLKDYTLNEVFDLMEEIKKLI